MTQAHDIAPNQKGPEGNRSRVAEDLRGRTLCGDPIADSSPWLRESGRMLGSGLPGWRRVAALYVPLACPCRNSVSSLRDA